MRRTKIKYKSGKINVNLLILTIIILFIGIVAIADASAPSAMRDFQDKFYFAKQQSIRMAIGLILMLIISRIHFTFWNKIAVPMFFLSILLLVVVLIPGVSLRLQGARRWIDLGVFVLQPTEVMKLSLAIYFAKLADTKKHFSAYVIPLHLIAFLIMLQPDLGTTLIIMFIGLTQIFIVGFELKKILYMFVVDFIGVLTLILASDYRRERLMTFFDQTADPLDTGYHIRQILFALGSGGLWGVGLGQSRQKYLFLPETATDSIFAVIAEETGFLGASILIIILCFFVYVILKIAKGAPDVFSQVLSFGILAWLAGQIIINIASIVALVPLTGVPLPLISYGGSSLIFSLCAIGIILNISRYAEEY